MALDRLLISAAHLQHEIQAVVLLDCRFVLTNPDAGELAYSESHLPGAHYLHLERDLSAQAKGIGGRHPLPTAQGLCQRLAQLGVGRDTPVVIYDDSRLAYAARCWWLMRALGYTRLRILDGGFGAWLAAGLPVDARRSQPTAVTAHSAQSYAKSVDIEGVRAALTGGAILIDSREQRRYLGLEEPIDPVAGHIPGALNFPWQGVTDEAGLALPANEQSARWSKLEADRALVVYCGSGVTACVNILSLSLAGREDVQLYAGSWSDWCARMPTD